MLLYQYWIYRVDPNRANEYGQVALDAKALDAKAAESNAVESKKDQ